ncbi:Ribosomal protein S18 acetylase RimI [Blastococcus aggregatus]|uniref:Ribosomal protein S18 acetylase RimI n=1 Tax=Blastococcus aggregatus TaxID=38502 RepID=A0A285UWP0_9ACTN|nr:GNAT family N-acetyltransferase [Blastococcus aggregatus]SOC46097.1 Ribosomal protein S18 acetylase RimI [Blastococcus aggregatus]
MPDSTDTYRVRQASADDLSSVLEVLAQNQAVAPKQAPTRLQVPSEQQRSSWDRMAATPDLTVYLAVHSLPDEQGAARERPVGTAAMMLMPHLTYDCRPSAFIEAVVVSYAHRRRGVARLLVQQALDDARAASCRKVQLLSHKRHADDGAHELYRRLGFTAEAEGFRLYL